MNKVFFSTLPHHAGQLLVALLFTTGSVVQAQTFEQSFAAAQRGDDRTAFAGFKKLAEQGNADAQYVLGLMYDAGRGTPKDERQAVTWYRKAAEQGYASAQLNLGLMYISGQGVSKDVQMAYLWWLLASAQGNQNAVKNRDVAEKMLSPAQRTAAQAAARAWKPTIQPGSIR